MPASGFTEKEDERSPGPFKSKAYRQFKFKRRKRAPEGLFHFIHVGSKAVQVRNEGESEGVGNGSWVFSDALSREGAEVEAESDGEAAHSSVADWCREEEG